MEERQASLRLRVTFPHRITLFGLVLGGYFPLNVLSGHTVLIDKNILILIRSASTSRRSDAEANRHWLQSLNETRIKINPGLCSLEGPSGRAVTFEEFCREHDAACDDLQKLLPKAQIVAYGEHDRVGAYDMQREFAARYQAESTFLMEVAPSLAVRPSDVGIRRIESEILQRARGLGLTGRSLALIASLSCLYESKNGSLFSPGRKVLKPKIKFDATQAHNAISDLRSLELLASTSALGLGRVALCTADKGLAAFWCGLNVKDAVWHGRTFKFRFDLAVSLFPRLPEPEVGRLLSELSVAQN